MGTLSPRPSPKPAPCTSPLPKKTLSPKPNHTHSFHRPAAGSPTQTITQGKAKRSSETSSTATDTEVRVDFITSDPCLWSLISTRRSHETLMLLIICIVFIRREMKGRVQIELKWLVGLSGWQQLANVLLCQEFVWHWVGYIYSLAWCVSSTNLDLNTWVICLAKFSPSAVPLKSLMTSLNRWDRKFQAQTSGALEKKRNKLIEATKRE